MASLAGAPGERWSAFLSYGFRPFFLGAGLIAVVAIPVWLATLVGGLVLPAPLPPPLWHGHEMLFGYGAAALAGFLLTATPSWSRRPPVQGAALALLAGLWLMGRLAMAFGAGAPLLAAALDLAFLPVLAAMIWPALRVAARRNLLILPLLGGLGLANLGVHLDGLDLVPGLGTPALRLALDLLALLVGLIGGRIVPAFTTSAAADSPGPTVLRPVGPIDHLALSLLAALVVVDLVAPGPVAGAVALLAALANAVRLQGWWTRSIATRPIVWVLHLGYAWLALGLAWKAAIDLTGLAPPGAAAHGLAIGAIGTMTLAVMSRAALGHTGRPLIAAPATVASYALVSIAALARLAAALLEGPLHLPLLVLSGAAWTLAFALFLGIYTPILVRRRADATTTR